MVSFALDTVKFLLIYRHLQNTYWFNRGSEGGIRMVNLFFIVVSACLVSTDVLLWMLWAGERRNQLV